MQKQSPISCRRQTWCKRNVDALQVKHITSQAGLSIGTVDCVAAANCLTVAQYRLPGLTTFVRAPPVFSDIGDGGHVDTVQVEPCAERTVNT